MTETHWRQEATGDLRDIRRHIARDNIVAADGVVDSIIEAVGQLSDFPESGPPRLDISPHARMLVVGSYLVLYQVEPERTSVVRIVHGSRDPRQFAVDFEGP